MAKSPSKEVTRLGLAHHLRHRLGNRRWHRHHPSVAPPAIAIAQRIFCRRGPVRLESHRLYYGQVTAPDSSEVIDQVLFVLMRGPRSYTGEDVVEIHGRRRGDARRIIEACLSVGARSAQPGEFTRQAFLAGKLDLAQAEAVASLLEGTSRFGQAAPANPQRSATASRGNNSKKSDGK